jgi:hypothetical protein
VAQCSGRRRPAFVVHQIVAEAQLCAKRSAMDAGLGQEEGSYVAWQALRMAVDQLEHGL